MIRRRRTGRFPIAGEGYEGGMINFVTNFLIVIEKTLVL